MMIESLYQKFLHANGVTTDTRSIAEGALFFALKGDNFNGNAYAEEAIQKGASYSIVDEARYASHPKCILVPNVLECLQNLAHHHRMHLDIPVIAVTGSNGKTTSKELLHVALSTKYKVAYTQGNLNNHIGVPLTLLTITNEDEIALVEMGDNHRYEVALLCEIAAPNFGFVTNIGKDHLAGFGTFENNVLAKKEVFDYLTAHQGTAFVDVLDTLVSEVAHSVPNVVYYGEPGAFDYIQFCGSDPVVSFKAADESLYTTHMFGEFNFKNIALASCIGKYFKVPTSDMYEALSAYVPSNNRSQVEHTGKNTLIMDAYNANPSSVQLAVQSLAQMKTQLAKWVVLGDMFELGAFTAQEHQEMADFAAAQDFSEILLVGTHYAQVKPKLGVHVFEQKADAEAYIKKIAPEGAIILLKGSRGMRLESFKALF